MTCRLGKLKNNFRLLLLIRSFQGGQSPYVEFVLSHTFADLGGASVAADVPTMELFCVARCTDICSEALTGH